MSVKIYERLKNTIDFSQMVVIDIETTGLDRFSDKINTVQIGYINKDGEELEKLIYTSKVTTEELVSVLNLMKKAKLVAHGGKFDLLFLYVHYGVLLDLFADTLVMAHICGEENLKLNHLVEKYYGDYYDISEEDKLSGEGKVFREYARKDVVYPRKLYNRFKKFIKAKDLVEAYKVEMRAYRAYIKVETKGVYISPERAQVKQALIDEYSVHKEELDKVAKINWNSSTQVALVLFSNEGCEIRTPVKMVTVWKTTHKQDPDELLLTTKTKKEAQEWVKSQQLPVSSFDFVKVKQEQSELLGYGLGLKPTKKTDTGNYSVDDQSLTNLLGEHPVIEHLIEYKRLTKLETFINSLDELVDEEGRVHPSFNITTRTGRTSCKGPNIQQLPADSRIRSLVTAPKGKVIIQLDYSQMELRVASVLSQDENMINAYRSGSDLHTQTMKLMFGDIDFKGDKDMEKVYRVRSKSCNFGFLYGMQAKSFMDYAKGYGLNLTLEEAEEFRNNFIASYPSLVDWWEEMKSFARRYGYSETMIGRKRFLPDIWRNDFKRKSQAERQAINSPVQGMASDICISAMSDVVFSTELDHSKFHVLGTVHDAILLECDEDYAEELGEAVREIMVKPTILKDIDLGVPLVADLDIGRSW